MKYIKSFKIFESETNTNPFGVDGDIVISLLFLGYYDDPMKLVEILKEEKVVKDGILQFGSFMKILSDSGLNPDIDEVLRLITKSDKYNLCQFYFMKEIYKDIVKPTNELLDKIEEFDVLNGNIIDSISLEHLYDYYGCILNIEDFENLEGCEIH